MAYGEQGRQRGRWREDEREEGWGRPAEWRGDQGFGGGWGNQTARPPSYGGGGYIHGGDYSGRGGDIRYGGPGFGGDDFRSGAREFEITRGDAQYAAWRDRQIAELDRDYFEFTRENQARFDREFGAWRERRGEQRKAVGEVKEHMEVTGSDSSHVGTVDKVRGEHIILTKSDPDAGGLHHSIPCGWIERVDDKVVLNIDAEEAKQRWRTESRSRALFERERGTVPGPHMLNRSFAGTYPDEE